MPLPAPNPAEDRTDFIGRCVIDPNIQADFNTMDQRVAVCNSLWEQEVQVKSVKATWAVEFERQLTRAERDQIAKFRRYYNNQYDEAIAMFIRQGSLSSADVQVFFKESELTRLYEKLYEDIGLTFANWYAKNFDKFISKALNLPNQQAIWANSFAFVGNQVAGQRVTSVSGTAKNTLIAVTTRLMKDPDFQKEGSQSKGRILKGQFAGYSKYQSERLVRTEATNAANYATLTSASDLFAGSEMMKQWIAGRDARVRPAHQAAQGQIVPFNKKFLVGGESLNHAGDPAGSAGNVINCRCSVAPFPKPNAQTIGDQITDIGFGLASATAQSAIQAPIITDVAIVAEVAQQVQNQTQKELMRPDNWNDVVPKGVKIDDDYLELLLKKPTLAANQTGSFYQPFQNLIEINTKRHGKETINKVLAHEFGHLAHTQHNWVSFINIDPSIEKLMDKQFKSIFGSTSGIERAKLINSYNDKFYYDPQIRAKFAYMSDNKFEELLGDTADYFGALTKNEIGWGHENKYYTGITGRNMQAMEMIAHSFENKYVGNPVFKELFPLEYEESITLLNNLINQIKK